MNLTAVLLTGLLAGGVSCAAVQGGLLAGLVARQQAVPEAGGGKTGRGGGSTHARGASATRSEGRHRSGPARRSRGGGQATGVALQAPPSLAARLGDDLAPVGGFMAGKLVSHAALGALLGALGTVVELSVGVRTFAQLAAGALIIAFGLAQLGLRGFERFTVEPPAVFTRFVRGRARSQSALAPAMLGVATVLIPCGVTLSVEALALTSGSALRGAATMAVFVVGTSPLFAVLGYAARKAVTAWRGRLSTATGLVVLLLGLYTFNSGLELSGSGLAASRLTETMGLGTPQATAASVSTADGRQVAVLTATTGSYSPANIAVRAGLPTTLLVRSDGAQGCVRSFVIPAMNKQWILPENGETPIDLGELQPGQLDYSCGMGMYTGRLTITP